jgi:hypothetical protein
MKNLMYLIAIFIMVACSTGASSFEKVISEYKQMDPKTGSLYDLNFKMIEMGELQKITVADSLEILETEFQKENSWIIENYNTLLSMVKKNLEQEKKSRRPSATMIDVHEKDIKKYEEKIAEIKSNKPDLSKYSSRNADEILANVIVCTYSMDDLLGNNFTEKSEFLLSPDGTTVYGTRRIRE